MTKEEAERELKWEMAERWSHRPIFMWRACLISERLAWREAEAKLATARAEALEAARDLIDQKADAYEKVVQLQGAMEWPALVGMLRELGRSISSLQSHPEKK